MENFQQKLKKYLNENYNLRKRVQALQNKKLYSLEIELTNACNLSCVYCYARAKSTGIFLPFDKAAQILKQAKEYGIKRIVWLGGEPTMHPLWQRIISFSKNLGIKNELWSNGILLFPENRKKISELVDIFTLHLDTICSENFCQVQRDRKNCAGIHFSIISNFKKLLEEGYPKEKTRITITLTKNVLADLKQTLQFFLEQLGVKTSILVPVYKAGRGVHLSKNAFLERKELFRAFEMRSLIEKRPELMLLGPSELCKHYQRSCAYIKANGNVLPYAAMDDAIVGNVYGEDLGSILNREFKTLSFTDYTDERENSKLDIACRRCKNSKFCFGTLAALHIAKKKRDPNCWLS